MGRKGFKDHGLSNTPQHIAWQNTIARCHSPTHSRYARYGGRGIVVCERWHTYLNFLEDMGERPEGMSLERLDNDKGYSPDNCKWATRSEQARNSSQNRVIEYAGKTQTLVEWALELGINYQTLHTRLTFAKLTVEQAFTRPLRRNSRHLP